MSEEDKEIDEILDETFETDFVLPEDDDDILDRLSPERLEELGISPRDGTEHLPHVMFSTNGKGRWWKVTWEKQCPEKVFLTGKCQGVEGHKGVHWCYGPCGSFNWDDNENDPSEEGGAGSIPPGHRSYHKPEKMQKHYYMTQHTTVEVTDPEEIARLERGEMKNNESINRPVTPENTDPETLKMLEERSKDIPESKKPWYRRWFSSSSGKPKIK